MTDQTNQAPRYWTVLYVRNGAFAKACGRYAIASWCVYTNEHAARSFAHSFNEMSVRGGDTQSLAVALAYSEALELVALGLR